MFGKRIRYLYIFIYNLKLKKNKNLFNRDLIKNYFFYNFFIKSFKKNKISFLSRSLFLLNINKILINPTHSYNKNLFNDYTNYNNFLKKNDLNHFFLKKKLIKELGFKKETFGLNYFLISNKINDDLIKFICNDENEGVVKLKFIINNEIDLLINKNVNFFLIHGIYLTNLIEIYKIIILINIVFIYN